MRTTLIALIAAAGAAGAEAAISNVDAVSAGADGSPPYLLQSLTVGGYTVDRSELRVGVTEALPGGTDAENNFFGTWPAPYDPPAPSSNFDLHDILARNQNTNPIIVKNFGGLALWTDVNGDDPDFFLFESASGEFGDSDISVQAILPGDLLGASVDLPGSGQWGDTGLSRAAGPNNGQAIKGIAFSVTDLLDEAGGPLAANASLVGLQINSTGVDPSLVAAAAVPEPATYTLAAATMAAWALLRRRRFGSAAT